MAAVRHRLEYTASGVPLSQIIKTLQAHQRLLPKAITALTILAPGSELRIVDITVDEIKAGSLIVDLILQLYGTYQKDVDKKVIDGVESLLGVDVPKEYEALVTLMLIGVAFYVSRWAYDAVRKKRGEVSDRPHITGNYNQVITIIADKLSISTDAVDAAIAGAVQPSRVRQLLNAVAAFMRPARSNLGSAIEGGGFRMEPEAIAEFPSDSELREIDEKQIVNLPDTLIDIRALDKDRGERGWAAKIVGRPDYANLRLPMDLYPTVNARALAKLETVRADLAVEMHRDGSGEMRPKRLHLLAYQEPKNDKPPRSPRPRKA